MTARMGLPMPSLTVPPTDLMWSSRISCSAAAGEGEASVVACEGFPPMAQLARRIVARTCAERPAVSVVARRSDELTCVPTPFILTLF